MPVKMLKQFLDASNVKYTCILHSPAYTAQEIAASAHIRGHQLAKVVIIKIDGVMAMGVLPADTKVVLQDLRDLTGHENIQFATEEEFKSRFPECEPGAMPPFGNLYSMDVYVAESLAENDQIVFNAGTHMEVIQLAYADFERLAHPKVLSFST
jgi:Ala-tRNA(Pro) deacylase